MVDERDQTDEGHDPAPELGDLAYGYKIAEKKRLDEAGYDAEATPEVEADNPDNLWDGDDS